VFPSRECPDEIATRAEQVTEPTVGIGFGVVNANQIALYCDSLVPLVLREESIAEDHVGGGEVRAKPNRFA
jgi:hypothetical protein